MNITTEHIAKKQQLLKNIAGEDPGDTNIKVLNSFIDSLNAEIGKRGGADVIARNTNAVDSGNQINGFLGITFTTAIQKGLADAADKLSLYYLWNRHDDEAGPKDRLWIKEYILQNCFAELYNAAGAFQVAVKNYFIVYNRIWEAETRQLSGVIDDTLVGLGYGELIQQGRLDLGSQLAGAIPIILNGLDRHCSFEQIDYKKKQLHDYLLANARHFWAIFHKHMKDFVDPEGRIMNSLLVLWTYPAPPVMAYNGHVQVDILNQHLNSYKRLCNSLAAFEANANLKTSNTAGSSGSSSITFRILGGIMFLCGIMLILCLLTQIGRSTAWTGDFFKGTILAVVFIFAGRKLFNIRKRPSS